MGVISGAGTAYPSEAREFIPVFSVVRVGRSLGSYSSVLLAIFAFFL